jgi:hypothetical protein
VTGVTSAFVVRALLSQRMKNTVEGRMDEVPGAAPESRPEVPRRVTQQGRSFGRIPFAEQATRPLSFQDRRSAASEVLHDPERRSTGSRPRVSRSS